MSSSVEAAAGQASTRHSSLDDDESTENTTKYSIWPLEEIERVLLSASADIVRKMIAIFYANHYKSPEAVNVLCKGLTHPSVLLRHEIAYIMGQMGQPCAIPILIKLCDNLAEHPMVRHEAGEALAALGVWSDDVMSCVKRHLQDENDPVRETFQLTLTALERKKARDWKPAARTSSGQEVKSGFYLFTASARNDAETLVTSDCASSKHCVPPEYAFTKDPADGDPERQSVDHIASLGKLLCDESANLWDRYVAMFTLRNINTAAAAWQLALALDEKSSALLRHEICFVLGQMQLPICIEKLVERIEDLAEADLARHEAALALGSVGANICSSNGRAARLRALEILEKFTADPDPIVAESCLVSLHNIAWETGWENEEHRMPE